MISTEIRLFDSMSPVLKNIISSVDNVIKAMDDCARSSEGMIDTRGIEKARDQMQGALDGIHKYDEALIEMKINSEKSSDSIDGLSHSIMNNEGAMGKAIGTAKKLLGAYLSFQGVKKFVEAADEFQNVSTRLGMVAKSFEANQEIISGDQLISKIRQSASASRGEFMMTADVISKLGMQARNAFGSSDELITFAEQLNKNFKIAGTDAEGIRSVMYNLTQALASGVLRGQDFNAVMSNAPIILEKVAEYMGEDISQIRKLAEEGKLSSEVIKNAMLASAAETNEAFKDMPKTFADIMTDIKNRAQAALSKAFIKWEELLNNDNMQKTIEFIIDSLVTFIEIASDIISVFIDILGPVLSILGEIPGIIMTVVTAFFAFRAATLAVNAAMVLFNATCNANPIILIATVVLTLIMLTIRWIQSVGGLTIAWLKFKLVVMKIFSVLHMVIAGFMGGVASAILGVVSMVLNAVQSIANGVIKTFNFLIKGINHIPGVNVGLIGEAKFADNYDEWSNKIRDKMGDGLVAKAKELSDTTAGIENEIKIKQDEIAKQKEAEKANTLGDISVPKYEDMLGGMGNDLAKTSGAAGSIDKKLDDGLEVSNEDLKEIKDVMFQRAIQNLSWDKIDVHVDNTFGDVHETADTDSIIKSIEDGLYAAVERVGVMA